MKNAVAAALKGGVNLENLKELNLNDAALGAPPRAGLEGVKELEAEKEGAAR